MLKTLAGIKYIFLIEIEICMQQNYIEPSEEDEEKSEFQIINKNED
jgi:hypothetical protein